MGIILFSIGAIVEVVFAFFCIVTKSNHSNKRSLIRIISLTTLILLIMCNTIEFSIQYYALIAVIALSAIVGFVNLIQKRKQKKEYKTSSIVLKTIGMVILLFLSTLPAVLFPQNTLVLKSIGMYHVLTNTATYTDTDRIESYTDTGKNRTLNVQFWYPDVEDKIFPLIVFSHGGLGVKSSNESLYNELASHGYVVVSIDHTFHSFFTTNEKGKTTWIDFEYMQQMLRENPLKDKQQSFEYYKTWMKTRMDDINFVIDRVISNSSNISLEDPYKSIDITKIGVMGHSLGGSAALGIGRIRDDVQAIVALESPFMADIEGIDNDGFIFNNQDYPLPVLNIYSDSSWTILDKRPQYAANYALLTEANPNVFNVHIQGVGHLSLTDFSLTSPILTRFIDRQESTIPPEEALQRINKLCLDFFNTYLKEGA